MPHPRRFQSRVAVLEPGTQKWRVLLEDAADARYVRTGHLAFLRQGTLMLVPFDPRKLEITGNPFPVIDNVMQSFNAEDSWSNTAAGQFSISASGSLVFAPGGILPDVKNNLVWVDRNGNPEPIASFTAPFVGVRLSPDGRRTAARSVGREWLIWIYDLVRGTATKLVSEGLVDRAIWTPDSRRVVFGWSKEGISNIY